MDNTNVEWFADIGLRLQEAAKVGGDYFAWHLTADIQRNVREHYYESPIEALFHAWWNAVRAKETCGDVGLRPQCTIEAAGRKYRLDFVVEWEYREHVHPGFAHPMIAVELDGHDFHERTKEQVAQRNERDRDLQSAGWKVYHVSGSELYREPERVVRQICNYVNVDLIPWFNAIRRK